MKQKQLFNTVMIIGVPRERKEGERRVAVTPDGVSVLVSAGHKLRIEKGAGELSGFLDSDYQKQGAEIVPTLGDVWASELVVKVKEPVAEEIEHFRPGLSVFCFLHLAVFPELTKALRDKEVTGLDYDLLKLPSGKLPILEPMSVIAGKLGVQCGAEAMLAANGGSGKLLGGAVGVKPSKVVVLGAGAAGTAATYVASGMGANVVVFDINYEKLSQQHFVNNSVTALYSTPPAVEREIKDADLVIGAVLIPGALAPKLVKKEHLDLMKENAVLVDICIDQGGVAETSKPTTISKPTFKEHGVIHYCVPNMPALVPQTSTAALTNETLKWLKKIADTGVEQAIRQIAPVRESVVTHGGKVTNEEIAEALKLDYSPLD